VESWVAEFVFTSLSAKSGASPVNGVGLLSSLHPAAKRPVPIAITNNRFQCFMNSPWSLRPALNTTNCQPDSSGQANLPARLSGIGLLDGSGQYFVFSLPHVIGATGVTPHGLNPVVPNPALARSSVESLRATS